MFYIVRNEIDLNTQEAINLAQWYLGPNNSEPTNIWSYDGSKAYKITTKKEALYLLGTLISENFVVGISHIP